VHFWGSFDVAVTRFSVRQAPTFSGAGSVPNMPESVVLDAYSDEVSSAGFWPGGQGIDYTAFYSYASPSPPGFGSAPIRPAQALWNRDLNQYLLPYDAVRAADPRGSDGILDQYLRDGRLARRLGSRRLGRSHWRSWRPAQGRMDQKRRRLKPK
jgi:hypothetical protein